MGIKHFLTSLMGVAWLTGKSSTESTSFFQMLMLNSKIKFFLLFWCQTVLYQQRHWMRAHKVRTCPGLLLFVSQSLLLSGFTGVDLESFALLLPSGADGYYDTRLAVAEDINIKRPHMRRLLEWREEGFLVYVCRKLSTAALSSPRRGGKVKKAVVRSVLQKTTETVSGEKRELMSWL